ncbi:MAG: hypothetical protein BGP25_05460 [Lysobacterales bacterium 63-13]|nr:MAG: hypothetical protein BGP25_05460 [Xanthomonadales bacterium 63-13]
MKRPNRLRVLVCTLLGIFASGAALAQGGGAGALSKASCPDAKIMGSSLFSSLCYNCFFPIRVAGAAGGPNVPNGAASPACMCPGRLGFPTPGFTFGMWYPDKIFETVRMPYCSPTLGKQFMAGSGSTGQGGGGFNLEMGGPNTRNKEETQRPYYNFHIIAFPIGQILHQMQSSVCVSGAASDANMLYASELDPTWNNTSLSMLTTPEAVLFANPIALAACIADGVAATVTQPIESLFWCAGTLGGMYPFTGFNGYGGAPQRVAAITNTRALGAMHRRGLALQAKGDVAVCSNMPAPIIVKNQYKWQQAYPVPETISNHWIGESVWRWGQFRHIPAVGEDFINILWIWDDCCVNE